MGRKRAALFRYLMNDLASGGPVVRCNLSYDSLRPLRSNRDNLTLTRR